MPRAGLAERLGADVRETRTLPFPIFLLICILFTATRRGLSMTIPKRIGEWLNIDNIIDVIVDAMLVVFEAFTTPILIPIRLGKYCLKYIAKSSAKRFLKSRVRTKH